MAEQDNLNITRQVWDAWNAHDIEGALKNIDENHVWESDTLPAPLVGGDAYRQAMQMYLTAFPDLRFVIDQRLASGDYVVTRYTATGTHRGDLMGIAPTNKLAETHGCTIADIKNGKAIHTLGLLGY
jgi:predicted ester cyclase